MAKNILQEYILQKKSFTQAWCIIEQDRGNEKVNLYRNDNSLKIDVGNFISITIYQVNGNKKIQVFVLWYFKNLPKMLI